MRVLHIGKFFPPHAGGIERFSTDLDTALVERGVDVAMLAHAEPGTHLHRSFKADGVAVTLAACHAQWLYAPVSPGFPILLRRVVRDFRPDLLHLHVPNTSAFWALLVPAARRLPWVVHWHSDVAFDAGRMALRMAHRLYKPWEQMLLAKANTVVATSAAYRDASPALAGWHAKTTIIPLGLAEDVHNAANATSPENLEWPGDGLRVLAVGRLSYYKGFDVLLRAIAQFAQANLVLIGSGECEQALRRLANELGIGARVKFAGKVGDAALASAYERADVFCLPSIDRSEAFGLVLLEAMRARLPVVASAITGSGVGHVVEDGISGLLVPVMDAEAIGKALRKLAEDKALRTRMGANGQRRWREEFSLKRVADQTLALYQSVLAPSHPRAAAVPVTSPPPE